MNNQTMIEQARNNFRMWDELKTQEVASGILTQEKYEELKAESLRVLELQIKQFSEDAIIEKIRNVATENGISEHNISDSGGTVLLRSSKYDILIDIGENQEYYRLATSKHGFVNGYDDEKNITLYSTLRGVSGYIKRFTA